MRTSVVAVMICAWAGLSGIVVSLPQKQYLDAGSGRRPFDVTRRSVPLEEILGGGPPRDGIPALDDPKFVTAREAEKFLGRSERVLGVALDGAAKAYPIKILNWHEIVNDRVGPRAVLVTW